MIPQTSTWLRALSLSSLLLMAHTVHAADAPLKIAIIGDSTVSEYKSDDPHRGWGQLLPEFFQPGTSFENQAKTGASTKTFPPERWQKVIAFQPEYVLIEFGFNDQHPKTQPESTDAATDFKDNLRRFIAEARQAKITPILVTPNHRRIFAPGQGMTMELEPYVTAMKEVGQELQVPVVDLYTSSAAMYEKLGEEGSTPLTINNTDKADRPGKGDRTHFTEQGARAMARLVAEGLAGTDSRLKAVIVLKSNAS